MENQRLKQLKRIYTTPEITVTRFGTKENIMIYGGGEETSNDGDIVTYDFDESSADVTDFEIFD